jgi:hypothetical protein
MSTRRTLALVLALLAATATLMVGGAGAQAPAGTEPDAMLANLGTAFTYQGRLMDAGAPAGGVYDFRATLFDAVENGNQVGSTVVAADVAVAFGVFDVLLDFGDVFDGKALFLELEVKADGDPDFTTLLPRQPLSATPYASYALDARQAKHADNAGTAGFADRAGVFAKPGFTSTVLGYDPRRMIQNPGSKPSMLIGWDGLPLVAYVEPGANQSLQLARCLDIACTGYDTQEIYAPQTPLTVNGRIYLNLARDGTYHLAFLDGNTLRIHALCHNIPCVHAYAGSSMQAMAAMIGTDGLPVIAYVDMTGNLKVLHCADLRCQTIVADNVIDGQRGAKVDPGITIGPNGVPVITYLFDEFGGGNRREVRVRQCRDLSCTQTVLVSFNCGNPVNDDDFCLAPRTTTAHDGEVRIGMLQVHSAVAVAKLFIYNMSGETLYELQPFHYLNHSQPIAYDLALTARADNSFFAVLNTLGWFRPPEVQTGNDPDVLLGSGLVAMGAPKHEVDTHFFLDSSITDTEIAATVGVDGLPIIAYVDGAGNLVFIHCGNEMCAPYFRGR